MKELMLLICIFFSGAIKAQDVASFGKAPSSVVKLYHPKNEQQTDLENTTALKKQKKKLGGFGGVGFWYELEGEKATVRLNADSAIFVLQQGTGMLAMDNSMTLRLFKLEVKNGKRNAVEGDYKPSILGTGKTTDTKITTSTKQLKEGLTKIVPTKKLEKGEYAFVSGMMEGNNYDGKNTKYIVYAFAID
ncbi:MAG: hypothetical protein H7Y86_03750 [Rhizobacter sp.]|nr:hypothetical protein [Ferruginibacter sp.]